MPRHRPQDNPFQELPAFQEISEEDVTQFVELPPDATSVTPPSEPDFDLQQMIGQAINTFAPEATFASPGGLVAELKPISEIGKDTLSFDDLFDPTRISSLVEIQRPIRGIRALSGPIGSGIVGGTTRAAINMSRMLINNPAETVMGFVTFPAHATYAALRSFMASNEFVQNLPEDLDSGIAVLDKIVLLRDKLVEISGEMSPYEQREADRVFTAMLAAGATGTIATMALRGTAFNLLQLAGKPARSAAKLDKVFRAKGGAVVGLAAFGGFQAEGVEERKRNIVMFALAAIPLGLFFKATQTIGKVDPKITDVVGRAREFANIRRARPLDVETSPIPEVDLKSDSPRSVELLEPREEAAPREPITDKLSSPDGGVIREEPLPSKVQAVLNQPRSERRVPSTREEQTKARENLKNEEPILEAIREEVDILEQAFGEVIDPELGHLNLLERFERRDFEQMFLGDAGLVRRVIADKFPGEQIFQDKTGTIFLQERIIDGMWDAINKLKDEMQLGFDPRKLRQDLLMTEASKPEAIIPDKVAAELSTFLQNQGDLIATILENVKTAPEQSIVLPLVDNLGSTLKIVAEVLGKENVTIAPHKRPDGLFDVAIGGEGSPLSNPLHRDQFIKEGFFEGQEVSYRGKRVIYQGQISGFKESVLVRNVGDSKKFQVLAKDLRRTQNMREIEGRPSSRDVLRDVLESDELAKFEKLQREQEELRRIEARENVEDLTEEQVRTNAESNSMVFERTSAGTYVVRDFETRAELFRAKTQREAQEFINNSEQAESKILDGNTGADVEPAGTIMGPKPPPLRVNEPMEWNPLGKSEQMANAAKAQAPFWFQFKDWAAAVDNLFDTKIVQQIYLRLQPAVARAAARAHPFYVRLQKIQKDLIAAKVPVARWEVISNWIESQSYEQMVGSHLEGKGLLKNRTVTEVEVKSGLVLTELLEKGADLERIYKIIDEREGKLNATARALRIDRENLPQEVRQKVEEELAIDGPKDMPGPITPVEQAAVNLFDFILTHDLDEAALWVVTKLGEAKRTGSLNRQEFARVHGMKPEEIRAGIEIESITKDLAAQPDIPITSAQEIRNYFAHFASRQSESGEIAHLNQRGVNPNRAFVNEMIRSGENIAYERNPIVATTKYIRNAVNSIEVNQLWNEAAEYMKSEPFFKSPEGRRARRVVEGHLNELRGIPGESKAYVQKVLDTFFEKMGVKWDVNISKDLTNTVLAGFGAAFMGGRVGLALRDLGQFVMLHSARYGDFTSANSRTARAVILAMESTKKEIEALKDAGEQATVGILEVETPTELLAGEVQRPLGGFSEAMRTTAQLGLDLSLQKVSYEFAFRGTFLEARENALRNLSDLVAEKIDKREAYKRIQIELYDRQTGIAFDELVVAERYDEAASMLGQQAAREMIGVFGQANRPWGWNTNLGRLVTQFGTWSSNTSAFVIAGLTRGTKAQRAAFATRFAMSQAALVGTGAVLGINFFSWMTLPGLFFTGGPTAQTVGLLATALTTRESIDRDLARSRLQRLMPQIDFDNFMESDLRSIFPGSYFAGDWMKAFQEAENPVEFLSRLMAIPIEPGPVTLPFIGTVNR